MITEDRRQAAARMKATQNRSQVEQLMVLLAGAGALLILIMA
jgi:hypothetical protein